MLAPPHSLHSLLCQLCWQMLAPPHCLHCLLIERASRCPPLRTACTRSFSERAGRCSPVLSPSSPSCAAHLLLPSPPCAPTELLPPESPESPECLLLPLAATTAPPGIVLPPQYSSSNHSAATTAPPTAGTTSAGAPFPVSAAAFAGHFPSDSSSRRSMISLGAAVPPLALFHASTVFRSHVGHTSVYLKCASATHARWNGLGLHCEHLNAGWLRTDSPQNRHSYVPSYSSTLTSTPASIAFSDICAETLDRRSWQTSVSPSVKGSPRSLLRRKLRSSDAQPGSSQRFTAARRGPATTASLC